MEKFKVRAEIKNLEYVIAFVDSELKKHNCSDKAKMQITIAVEEIFVNIARYAYGNNIGNVVIYFNSTDNPKNISIKFIDEGIKYNPIEKKDPDITLSAEERQVGGLGIYMTKKIMDDIKYEYKDGQNILIINKILE